MSYASAKQIDASAIPVIDLAPLASADSSSTSAASVGRAMLEAAQTVGFFYIKNHGIAQPVIDAAATAGKDFFSLPAAEKQRVAINRYHHGFLQVGEAKMYDSAKVDLKESFVWGLDLADDDAALTEGNPFLGRNQWPAKPAGYRDAVYAFFEASLNCGQALMRAFAAGMGLAEDTFVKSCDLPVARSSVIYYPPQPSRLGSEQFGVAPHTDYGCLTLLWQDEVGGLEVLNAAREWVTAHPVPGTLVVNIGDLLARWTNGRFRSTPHRVINRAGRERYSMTLFWDPNFETVIDPAAVCAGDEKPRYEPVRCGDYILRRLDRAFAYRSAKTSTS